MFFMARFWAKIILATWTEKIPHRVLKLENENPLQLPVLLPHVPATPDQNLCAWAELCPGPECFFLPVEESNQKT